MKKLFIYLTFLLSVSQWTHAGSIKDEFLYPLEREEGLNKKLVQLGGRLFREKRLSKDNSTSCLTCHDLSRGGVDHLPVSFGINQQKGDINAPTVFNVSKNTHFFWDGRAKTLEEQLDGPVTNPKEMDSSWGDIAKKLKKIKAYRLSFDEAFKDGINEKNIKKAIVEFEKSLVLVDSPFDLFLKGNERAISLKAKRGYKLFKTYGCVSCHQGQNIGGNMFQKFGALKNIKKIKKKISKSDYGRFNVTGKERERYVFRVPSLRNVALTAPYFHDGSAKTLKQAISKMGQYQLGRKIKNSEIENIEEFLKSLSGEFRENDQ